MEKLKFSLLTNKNLHSAIGCVVKVFLYDEPMTKNLKITEPEFKIFATLICKKCVLEKLSYVCKNPRNKVVGFCLNEDMVSGGDFSFENITEKMNPFFNILEMLDSSYLRDK